MDCTKYSNITYLQQGDTLYAPGELPKNLTRLKGGVVQEGKLTGHAHRFEPADVELYEDERKEKYLRVLKPTALTHEEHKTIMFPKGDYKIGIITEYDPLSKLERRVID